MYIYIYTHECTRIYMYSYIYIYIYMHTDTDNRRRNAWRSHFHDRNSKCWNSVTSGERFRTHIYRVSSAPARWHGELGKGHSRPHISNMDFTKVKKPGPSLPNPVIVTPLHRGGTTDAREICPLPESTGNCEANKAGNFAWSRAHLRHMIYGRAGNLTHSRQNYLRLQ